MKILLASLLCLVLSGSECFALRGGPVYPRSVVVAGSYTGLFLGAEAGSSNLGIFTLDIPQIGLANGTILLFTGARTFTGTIQALGDSRSGTVRGIVEAIPRVSATGITITTLNAHADGSFVGTVRDFVTRGFTGARTTHLIGTARIATTGTDAPGTSDYTIDGLKQ